MRQVSRFLKRLYALERSCEFCGVRGSCGSWSVSLDRIEICLVLAASSFVLFRYRFMS